MVRQIVLCTTSGGATYRKVTQISTVTCPVFWWITIKCLEEAAPFSVSWQQACQSCLHGVLGRRRAVGWAGLSAFCLIRPWRSAICNDSDTLPYSVSSLHVLRQFLILGTPPPPLAAHISSSSCHFEMQPLRDYGVRSLTLYQMHF